MALIARISRLFRADVNAVLDRMEEPEVLLKQAIREMDEELVRDDRRAKIIALDLKQLSSRQTQLEQRLQDTEDELDLCFDSGNETLARVLLKRKLESERFLNYLVHKREELKAIREELGHRIDENRSCMQAMQQKAELLADGDCENDETSNLCEPDLIRQFTVNDDDIELAYLREKQRRMQS